MSFKILKKVCLYLSTIIFFDCSTTNKPADVSNSISPLPKTSTIQSISIVPRWFTQKLNNSDLYLYGAGSDNSYQKAIDKALADMVQRLEVSFSASTSLQTINLNDDISQKLVQEVSNQTADINITNYKIINQRESNGIFYVQLEININETIALLKQTISNQVKESLQLIKNSENKSFLNRFDSTQKLNKKIQIIKNSLRTLIILVPETYIENSMVELDQINNATLNLKKDIVVKITRNNSDYFFDSRKKYLQVNNFNYSQKNPNIILSLKILDYDNEVKEDQYYIKTRIEIHTSDAISKQLAPETYNMRACPNEAY